MVALLAAPLGACASSGSDGAIVAGTAPATSGATAPTTTVAPAPPLDAALAALADRTTMTAAARDLFARSTPELVGKDGLAERCAIPEQTNVLGCYHAGRIAVLDVTDPRLDGMEETTAAHELLHAVWERLAEAERQALAERLRAVYDADPDPELHDKVEAYRRRDPTVVDNELHSILGTEVAALDPVLEAHYAGWFADRAAVVALAARSQRAFTELEAQIRELDGQLDALREDIAAAEVDLDGSRQVLEARSEQLRVLRDQGRIEEYNAGVDPYNAAVAAHNAAVAAQRRRIDRFNGTVAVRNALGADHDQLVDQITTAPQPFPATP